MKNKSIKLQHGLKEIDRPLIMGIVNLSPDSFYSGSKVNGHKELIDKIRKMLVEGADIIDIGAVSSRPGAEILDSSSESKTLMPALKAVRREFSDMVLSVDTYNSRVAQMAVEEYGVDMINDISGGQIDAKMFETIGRLKVPYVLMHIQGTPLNMQKNTCYNDLIKDVFFYFSEKIKALHQNGVVDIIIDPGFGFAKTMEQNYELLNILEDFTIFPYPVLVGFSRKTMIWKLLQCEPEGALNGTTVLNTLALQKGADILRVHDVKEAVEVVKIFTMLKSKVSKTWK